MKTYSWIILLGILFFGLNKWLVRKVFEIKLSKRIKRYVSNYYGEEFRISRLKIDKKRSKISLFKQTPITYYQEVLSNQPNDHFYFKIIRPGIWKNQPAGKYLLMDTYQVGKWEQELTSQIQPLIRRHMKHAVLITSLDEFELCESRDQLDGKTLEYMLKTIAPLIHFDVFVPSNEDYDIELYLHHTFELKQFIQNKYPHQEFILTIKFLKNNQIISDLSGLRAKAAGLNDQGFRRESIRYYHNLRTSKLDFKSFSNESLRIRNKKSR